MYEMLLGAALALIINESIAKPILGKLFNDSYDAAKKALAPSIGNVLSKVDDKIKVLGYLDDAINEEDELTGREKMIVREAVLDELTGREKMIVREAVLEALSLKVHIDKEITQNKVDK